MVGRKRNPGAALAVTGAQNDVHAGKLNTSDDTIGSRPTQPWRPWMGGPSKHFPGQKHFTLTCDGLAYWLVEWPGGMATFAGFTRGEARQFVLKKQQKTGRPILVEDSA